MSAQFYRQQKEDRGRSRLIYATALIIIIFLLDIVAGGRLRSAVRLGASYVYLSLTHIGESTLGSGVFESRQKMLAENSQLRSEVLRYQEEEAAYLAMRDENNRLRSLVGLSALKPGRAASVISSLSASAYGTFTIDAGLEEGIARGAVVFTPDGYAIGVVSDTATHNAVVTELFAPNTSLEAVVSDTHIVLEGEGGGNARAKAPRESTIMEGSVVRSPKVDAPVGIIEHIESSATSADKELFVRIPANLQTLTLVYVGRK